MADYEVSKIMWIAIVVALAASIFVIARPQIKTLANSTFGQISSITEGIGKSDNTSPLNKINPNDAKWVTKGNYGTNGKFVVDKDGNAVIYAIDASKPIIFHNLSDENAKLPKATLTTLTFLDKVQGDTYSSMAYAFAQNYTNLKTINDLDTNVDTSNVTDMSFMFKSSNLTSVGDLGKWNTSNVTNMRYMFYDSQLTSVGDLSQWNTSKVTDMSSMFNQSELTTVGDLSQWKTSNVTNMYGMFAISKLTTVGDLSQWNTSKVTNMGTMFYNSKLTSVGDLSQWNTSNVYYMNSMFDSSKLTTVGDLSQWKTSNVTNMSYMFDSSQLTSVGDLSQWNTSKVTYMDGMFKGSQLTPPAWYH